MLEVFGNDIIRRILYMRRRDCVPSLEQRRRPCLTSISTLLVLRRLYWFGHAARRPEGELIRGLLLPARPQSWQKRAGGQLKTWATTLKEGVEPLSGPRVYGYTRWRKDWVNVSSGLAKDHRVLSASLQDVVNSIGYADSTRSE